MFKVETYINPLEFYKSIKVGVDELHITPASGLEMYIKEGLAFEQKSLKVNVIRYGQFYDVLYPKWGSKVFVLNMKQILRQIIKMDNHFESKKEILLKQVDGLIETYRYWLTLGFEEMISEQQDSDSEKLKIKLFNQFKEHEEIKKGFEQLNNPLTSRYIAHCLQEVAKQLNTFLPEDYSKNTKKIYVYAFDDLNPDRFQVFNRLSEVGHEVVFRIPYDPEYPNVYAGWMELYSKIVPIEDWTSIETSGVTSSILEFLEGKPNITKQEKKITIHQYNEPTLFKHYLNKHPLDYKKLEIIACEKDIINEVFRDEINENKEISHIFETPIGRFISQLYAVKEVDGKSKMTYEMYQQMISSGVINVSQIKGKTLSGLECVSLLSDLKVYMDGVSSLEEIKERLQDLKGLYEISDEFDELARSKVDRNHIKRYLQNPMRIFGFVNPQGYDLTLNQLILLTEELERQIRLLLKEKNPVTNMEVHVGYLMTMLKESAAYADYVGNIADIKYADMLGDVYGKFFKRLSVFKQKILELEEMNDYLSILGKFTSKQDEEGALTLVKGIEHTLGLCVSGVEVLYLCDLSTTAMNHHIHGQQRRIELQGIGGAERYIERLAEVELKASIEHIITIAKTTQKHIQTSIKFDMMTILTFYPGDIHMGWIKNMYPYDTEWYLLNILKQIYTVETVQEETDETDWFEEREIIKKPVGLEEEKKEELIKELSPFAWDDLQQCKKKFYYSNILSHYPVYRDDFTQRVAFGWLGKMFEGQFEGKEQVAQNFSPLFPQWTYTLKENLVATTKQMKMDDYIVFNNIKFPQGMANLWGLSEITYNEISDRKKQMLLNKYLIDNERPLESNEIGKRCYFCPHQIVCQEGAFGVDREY